MLDISHEDPPVAERAEVLGCQIDRLDMDQTLLRCESLISRGEFAQHVAINAAKLVAMHRDPEMRAIINRCELVSADGQSVVWASRLLGDPLPERVAGIDLMDNLLALAEHRGYRVYVLGAKQEVLERAVERIVERHPRLTMAGMHHGYFSDDEATSVAEEIRATRPDILFVAMSSPKKEYWLGDHGRRLGVPFVMGVGGSVDVMAGITPRAPSAMQRLGLEWLFRVMQEPRRLWRRYAVTNWRFVAMLVVAMVRRRR